jgi:hypothetical protein
LPLEAKSKRLFSTQTPEKCRYWHYCFAKEYGIELKKKNQNYRQRKD